VNYSVNLFSTRNMNSTNVFHAATLMRLHVMLDNASQA